MKNLLLLVFGFLLFTFTIQAQVGIGTISPQSSLDIKASNQATPANTDGLLIPRVAAFPVTPPTAAQNGMMVFLTTDNKFYYWNQTTTSWLQVAGTDDTDWNISGVNQYSGVTGNVGIGTTTPEDKLTLQTENGFGLQHTNGTIKVGTYVDNAAGWYGTKTNHDLRLYTNGTPKLAIKNTGNVGINVTNPNAKLEIVASNAATPSNTDGLLIPRVAAFPVTPPTAAQNGMMVFLTTNNKFYYWDQTTTSWLPVAGNGAEKINDLTDGKSDNDGSENGSSIYLGINAGVVDDLTDNKNVGIGYEALKANTTGAWNIANGYHSLNKNTSGSFNTAIGYQSLFSNTTGTSNTAIGSNSLKTNISGNGNTANGDEALTSNSTGNQNTAFGYSSLYVNSTGNNNTAIGYNSGFTNSTGIGNVFLGFASGYNELGSNKLYIDNSGADRNNALIYGEFDTNLLRINGELQIGNQSTTGYKFPTTRGAGDQVLQIDGSGNLDWTTINTNGAEKINDLTDGKSDNDGSENGSSIFLGIGAGTGDDASDNRNIGIGLNTLIANVTGSDNISIGNEALHSNTGSNNISIGYSSSLSNSTGTDNTVMGRFALSSNSIGGDNVAIGNEAMKSNTTTSFNTAIGFQALKNNIGEKNTVLGHDVLATKTNGNFNTAIGNKAGNKLGEGSNNTFVGSNAGNSTLSINRSGGVMIGRNAGFDSTKNNTLFIENSSADENNALIYGEFDTDLLRINGELQIGNQSTTGYNFPTTRGLPDQIMQTDGSGIVSWVDNTDDTDWIISGNDQYSGVTGNVGIGTTIPEEKLTVSTGNGYGLLQTNGTVSVGTFVNSVSGWLGTKTNHDLNFFTNGGSSQLIVKTSGDIGIGTTSPNCKLNIQNGTDIDGFGLGGYLRLGNNPSQNLAFDTNEINVLNNGISENLYLQKLGGNLIVGETGTNSFSVINGITDSKVGIGTITPEEALTVTTTNGYGLLHTNGTVKVGSYVNNSGGWYGTKTNHDLNFFTNGGSSKLILKTSGNIGIGTTSPDERLHVIGEIKIEHPTNSAINWTTGTDASQDYNFFYNGTLRSYIQDLDGSFNISSDRRLKNNIQNMEDSVIEKVMRLNPVTYSYKSDSTSRKQNGFIAQEVLKLFPELVSEKEMKNGKFLTLRYDAFGVLAIKTIQEQQTEIDMQQTEIENLKKEILKFKELEARIALLEKK